MIHAFKMHQAETSRKAPLSDNSHFTDEYLSGKSGLSAPKNICWECNLNCVNACR
ncbi:hypothetical protein [Endozoicomonas atrinae]|uniref:hypothetical protein n=1 Tax=Endozoicomonas atrinae TaxID=1333660 RepID=UPI003B008BA0